MKRYGSVVEVHPHKYEEYKRLHAAAWPGVLDRLKASHFSNYSIFYREGWLFSYFEYLGDDFEADVAAVAADKTTQEWWAVCIPCLKPLDSLPEGEIWAPMEEIFHLD
ncbi:MAG: L-rhamnose mutarotase [Puniceicoccaceae bacterium]